MIHWDWFWTIFLLIVVSTASSAFGNWIAREKLLAEADCERAKRERILAEDACFTRVHRIASS